MENEVTFSEIDCENKKLLLSSWLDAGEVLISSGAEINRVEDTISRLAYAYGALKTDVFVITSSIVLTVTFPEDKIYTVSKRLDGQGGTDFEKFEEVNELSRECCSERKALDTFRNTLGEIKAERSPWFKTLIGSIIAAGACGVLFGGELIDGVLAGLMGALVWALTRYLSKFLPNRVTFSLVSSIVIGLAICLFQFAAGVFLVDKVAIGVIMLLIPGLAITNAVRDMLLGNTISGALKFIQSTVIAMMIAAGFMLANAMMKMTVVHIATTDGIYQLVPALLISLGFALVFNLRSKYLPIVMFGGLADFAVYLFFELKLNLSVFWCCLFAGLFADMFSQVMARIIKTPATLFLVPTVIPLIPGSSLYYTAFFFMSGSPLASQYGKTTALVILGLAFGIGLSASFFSLVVGKVPLHKWKHH